MLSVAMLSGWHVHAKSYAREINTDPGAQVVAVWDENAGRGAAWAKDLNVGYEPSLDALLSRQDIEAVCVVAPTDLHSYVMVKAARAGKHIFTEKVLAPTLAECRDIEAAIAEANVKFCISFPRQTIPPILCAKECLDKDMFGQISLMRVRIAHDGATRDWLPAHFYDAVACGGGAMMDLGAHGMYLSRWLLGKPRRIVSVFNNITARAVEDNAVSVIEYENGAIVVNETSFVSYAGVFSMEIDGTAGGFRMMSPDEPVMVSSKQFGNRDWHVLETMPEKSAPPIAQWIDACANDSEVEFGIQAAINLTELMEGAYIAEKEQRSYEF